MSVVWLVNYCRGSTFSSTSRSLRSSSGMICILCYCLRVEVEVSPPHPPPVISSDPNCSNSSVLQLVQPEEEFSFQHFLNPTNKFKNRYANIVACRFFLKILIPFLLFLSSLVIIYCSCLQKREKVTI